MRNTLSVNEREFVLRAHAEEQRIDGRRPFERRPPEFTVLADGHCEVTLGSTRALGVVSAELAPPFRDRPNEGIFLANVELGPMAAARYEAGRPSDAAVELARSLERGLKQSGAVDTESLVVQAGRWVWSLRVDVHVLDADGNLAGAVSLAALGALLTFRRPEVSVSPETQRLVVHPAELREPLPLALHHLPVTVSFACLDGAGEALLLDPCGAEEEAAEGCLAVMLNEQGDVCGLHKAGGAALGAPQLLRCLRIAEKQAAQLASLLKEAVRLHSVAALSGRVRRHRLGPAAPSPFVLGARLEGEEAPAYLALPADAMPEAPDEQPCDAMEEEGGSFPFTGPLGALPQAGGEAATEAQRDSTPPPKPGAAAADAPAAHTLMDAVKPKWRRAA